MSLDPDELAASWLRIRRHFEAEAGRVVPAEQQRLLLDLTLEQLSLLGQIPVEGSDKAGLDGLGLPEGRWTPVVEQMVGAGMFSWDPAPGPSSRLVLTERGARARVTLDQMQKGTLRAMFAALGPDLSSQIVEVIREVFPDDN